ncbi:MAG TPA: hypothetical protein VFS14_02010 [Candidatus Saccharimonadales bacterium]|nr:hypothetical protein [Candidatus Saccharimonadales bacterium]
MFRRRNQHETPPAAAEARILPTSGRQISLLPGHDDDPEQPARVLAYYAVDNMEAGRKMTTEMIWAQTVTHEPRRMRVSDVNELLLMMGHKVAESMTEPGSKSGRYIIEYPRATESEPIRGEVYMLGAQMMKYAFEERGDEITVTGAEPVMSAKEKFVLPLGTRMTATVSMKERAGDPRSQEELQGIDLNNVVNTEAPTPEEQFTERIKHAIALYKVMQS